MIKVINSEELNLESLSFRQISALAHSSDIDASQFGHRAIRLLATTDAAYAATIREVLKRDLANEHFVAHLLSVLAS